MALGDEKHELVKVFAHEQEEQELKAAIPVNDEVNTYYHGPRSH